MLRPLILAALLSVVQPAAAADLSITLAGLAPGRYAVSAIHDENGNGKLDRNLLGIPTGGCGFSNDARAAFGPLSFEAAAYVLKEPGQSIVVTIRS